MTEMLVQPEIRVKGSCFAFDWSDINLHATLDRIKDYDDPSGELKLWGKFAGQSDMYEISRIKLLSSHNKTMLVKSLRERIPDIDWTQVLQQISIMALHKMRDGGSIQWLGDQPKTMEIDYTLYPILEYGQPTTLYAPGGSGKTYLADYIACLIGYSIGGIRDWMPYKVGNVLYLDWESSFEAHQRRIWGIKKGLGINDNDQCILYRFCTVPIDADIDNIQKLIIDHKVEMVIIDSQVAASGGNPNDAETARRYYTALRLLRCTSLTLDHVPKSQNDRGNNNATGPYGSVFKWNLSRSQYELKQTQELGSNEIELGLYHRKCNEGKLQKPQGIRIRFIADERDNLQSVKITSCDITQNAELVKTLPVKDQLLNLLKSGPLTVQEISEKIEHDASVVRARLNQYKGKYFTKMNNKWVVLENG